MYTKIEVKTEEYKNFKRKISFVQFFISINHIHTVPFGIDYLITLCSVF